jgi:hypothetical protein
MAGPGEVKSCQPGHDHRRVDDRLQQPPFRKVPIGDIVGWLGMKEAAAADANGGSSRAIRSALRSSAWSWLGPVGQGRVRFDATAGEGQPKSAQDFIGRFEFKK